MGIKSIIYRIKLQIRKDSYFRKYLNELKETLNTNEEILGMEINEEELVLVTKRVSDTSV